MASHMGTDNTPTAPITGPQQIQQPERFHTKPVTVIQAVISGVMLIVALVGGGWVVVNSIFCTKTEHLETKMEIKDKINEKVESSTSENKVRDWRIKSVEIRTKNIESRVERVDKNVERLLGRFQVRSAPKPATMPVPEIPAGLLLGEGEPDPE